MCNPIFSLKFDYIRIVNHVGADFIKRHLLFPEENCVSKGKLHFPKDYPRISKMVVPFQRKFIVA